MTVARSGSRPAHVVRRLLLLPVFLAMALFAGLVAGCGTADGGARARSTDTVHVHDGLLRGSVLADHRVFAGIPYAAPPTGDRRWRAPHPAEPWPGIRDATKPGNPCPQRGNGSAGGAASVIGDENCLYLNVTTPAAGDRDARLPVMVWLPGGGFVSGAGSDYDPARLAAQGQVVVVTLNYRLGALGFLLDRDLGADPAAGNFGLADQQAGLRWVRENIGAFGGDPRNVTLFGQSAGAYSVCAQLASPAAQGLFHKAIIQSGPCGNDFVTADVAEQHGARTAAALGCGTTDVAACLRNTPMRNLVGLDAAQVFTATGRLRDMPWTPVAGTPILPEQPLRALRTGSGPTIPLIQGTTREEMRPFVALENDMRGRPVTEATYPAIIDRVFGADAAAVLAEYPPTHYPTAGIALATVLTDWSEKLGACAALPADDAAARLTPVYAYEFTQDDGQRIGGFPLGAPHSAELPYLFDGGFEAPGTAPTGPPRLALARQLITYWSSFARTGNPNTDGSPNWPAYQAGGPVLSLAADRSALRPVDFVAEHHCAFWQAHRD